MEHPFWLAGTTGTYRLHFHRRIYARHITVELCGWKLTDSDGNISIDEVRSFTIAGTTATLSGGFEKQAVGLSVVNNKKYIEVTFNPTGGATLNLASITGDEISLSGSALNGVALASGTPLRVGTTNTFRYAFTGSFSAGVVNVAFKPGQLYG